MNTKIIITVGPSCLAADKLIKLFRAGVEVVRLNFSHATREQYQNVKKIVDTFNRTSAHKVRIILDLQGPRIRVGQLPGAGLILRKNEIYRFFYSKAPYPGGNLIPIDHQNLYLDIKKNDPLFLSNGELELLVIAVNKKIITARVVNGGLLSSKKGINVPYTHIKKGGLTTKDVQDAKFGLRIGVDYIALSFVQTAPDVQRLRRLLGQNSSVKIISKIERALALKNIDEIIMASDMVMVARGDLGIEIPIEDLPIVQKNLVRHAHWHNKPAIIATQVMTSMIKNLHPTRAEISDIANSVFDGADMIMLSDETAVGDYPLEAVKILKKVIDRTEKSLYKGNVTI